MKYRINEICREKGIYLKDLAEQMGRTPESLSRSLNNGTTTKMLQEIASKLDVEVYELFEREDSGVDKDDAKTIGIIRHNGKSYEINSISDIEILLDNIYSWGELSSADNLIEYMNKHFRLDAKIDSLEKITTNKSLEGLIYSIRTIWGNERFSLKDDTDIFYKVAICLFNNIPNSYFKAEERGQNWFREVFGADKKKLSHVDYLKVKMNIDIDGTKENVINQLFDLWINKYTVTIEYTFRGIEVLLWSNGDNLVLDSKVIQRIVVLLLPLIYRTERKLLEERKE